MDNLNSISYADDWKNASDPVVYEKPVEQNEPVNTPEQNAKHKTGKPLLTLIQIIICVIIVLAAFVIKQFGGDFYKTIKEYYQDEINNEIIRNPYENSLDELFDAFKD